jgi:hypothetical protein
MIAMLRSDRTTPLPIDVASELRDALSRRQKELPPRWLAARDAAALREGRERAPGHPLEATERELGLALLETHLVDSRPRGLVCLRPSASDATGTLVGQLSSRGCVTAVAAVELDLTLASEMAARLSEGASARPRRRSPRPRWRVTSPLGSRSRPASLGHASTSASATR